MTPMRALILALTLALMLAPGALAQPERRRPPAREGAPPESATADELRRFIRQRNATLERQQQILAESARMLDEGKSPDEVRAHMREAFAEDFEGRRDAFRDHLRDRFDRDRPPREEGPEDDGAPRADRPEPTPEEVLAVIKELNPRLHERLERVRAADEQAFRDMLRGAGERVRRFIDERRDHPDRFETRVQSMRLEREAREQARRVAGASPADRAAAEATLRATVSRLFDLRAKIQADDIERLGARLDGARRRFEAMVTNRDRLIEQHAADMVQRAESRPGRPEDDDLGDRPPPPPAR